MSVPSQPVITSQLTVLSSSSVSIEFDLVGNGGSSFTDMEYARSIDGYTVWTSLGLTLPLEGQTSATITGLSSPAYGSFKIRTTNAIGNSPASDPQTAISSYPPFSTTNWLTLSDYALVAASCTSSGQYMAGITNNNLFLASTDYGQTFTQVSIPMTSIGYMRNFATTSNGQTIYVSGTDFNMYRSTDYGQSFSPVTTGYEGSPFRAIVSSSDGTYVFAGSDTGSDVIMSTDSGVTWSNHGGMSLYWESMACSSNGTYVYGVGYDSAISENVMYKTSNSGSSWSKVPTFVSDPANNAMVSVSCNSTGQYVVVTAGTDGIYRSADYGSTWSLVNGNSGGAIGVNWVSIASDASGANLIAAEFTNACIYNSTDSGTTWTVINLWLNQNNAVAISQNGTYRIICSEDYYTVINQFSSQVTSPWTLTNGKYLKKVMIASDNLHMAAIDYNPHDPNNIAISTDGGANWTSTFAPNEASVEYVAASSLTGQKVYYITDSFSTYASTDYGATFSELTNAPNNANRIVCNSTGAYVFLGTFDGEIYVSSDSGANFTQTYSGIGPYVQSLTCSANGQYVYAADAYSIPPYSILYVSNDYGVTFSTLSKPTLFSEILCDSSGQKLFGVSPGGDLPGVAVSYDYGTTWKQTSFTSSVINIACDALGNRILIEDYNTLMPHQSLDAGTTWTPISFVGDSFNNGSGSRGLSISPDGTRYIVSALNPGTYRRTAGVADVEPVWTATNGIWYFQGAISTNNQKMVSLNYNDNINSNVVYSGDSGATWTIISDDIGDAACLAASASCQYVLVGNSDYDLTNLKLHYSVNYGETFTELASSAPAFYRGVAINSSGTHMIAIGAVDNGPYFSCLTSTDSGVTWTEPYQFPSFETITGLAASQTLDRLYVPNTGTNLIMASIDGGTTWSDLTSFTTFNITSVACDWTGRYVVVSTTYDGIWRSTDYGANWTKTNAPSGNANFQRIVSNSTGSRLLAFDQEYTVVYVSLDSGATWTTLSTPGGSMNGDGAYGLTISPDGTRSILSLPSPGTFFETYGTADLPAVPCFLEGTKILCKVNGAEQYVAVETIRPGMLVKTCRDGFKPVKLIGKRDMDNSGSAERDKNSLYLCSKAAYPELTEDLTITGCHAILVDQVTDVHRRGIIKTLERIFVTDKKYRLPACVDERASVVQTAGTFTVWHFALEHHDVKMNYGVYAQGLLVESSPIWHMNLKNYTLV